MKLSRPQQDAVRAMRNGAWIKRWYVYPLGQKRRKSVLYAVKEQTLRALLRRRLIEHHLIENAYRLTSDGHAALCKLNEERKARLRESLGFKG